MGTFICRVTGFLVRDRSMRPLLVTDRPVVAGRPRLSPARCRVLRVSVPTAPERGWGLCPRPAGAGDGGLLGLGGALAVMFAGGLLDQGTGLRILLPLGVGVEPEELASDGGPSCGSRPDRAPRCPVVMASLPLLIALIFGGGAEPWRVEVGLDKFATLAAVLGQP